MRDLRLHVGWICLVIFTLSSGIDLAQDVITPGEIIQAELSETQLTQEYTFAGKAGDVITITLSSRRFDAFLRLENAKGNLIAENDDFGGSLNARIENLSLTDDDNYTIIVSSADGSETGTYDLNLIYIAGQLIELGQTLEGEIRPDKPEAQYIFEGTAGDMILISLSSPDFDTFLEIADSNQNSLYTDDDGGDGTNSLIAGYELPETGTYFITARGYSNTINGTFTIQVLAVSFVDIPSNTIIDAEMNEPIHIYTFESEVGNLLNIDVLGEDGFDTALALKGPSGFIIINDDDSGEELNPEIRNWLAEQTGVYTIIVQSVEANTTGHYQLVLNVSKPEPIECGGEKTIQFSSKDNGGAFIFEAQPDQTIEIVFSGDASVISSLHIRSFQDGIYLAEDAFAFSEEQTARHYTYTANSENPIHILFTSYNFRSETVRVELNCP